MLLNFFPTLYILGGGPGAFVGDFREYIRLSGRGYRLSDQTSFSVPMDEDDAFQHVEDASESSLAASTMSMESDLLGPSLMDKTRSYAPRDGTPRVSSSGQAAREGIDPLARWANIWDDHPLHGIGGDIVSFEKWPEWFLEQGHPLGRSVVTRDFYKGVSADYIERIRFWRPPVDWEGLKPNFKVAPSFDEVNESVQLQHSQLTDREVLQELNRRLLLSGHRSDSTFEITLWDTNEPSMLHSKGVGFPIYDWLVDDFDISLPFPLWLVAVLNLLNAYGSRILRAFELKCQIGEVDPSLALFFYFFCAEWQHRGHLAMIRRANRPKLLTKFPSHPKIWEERFVLIRDTTGIRPWWISAVDNRPMFPLG